MNFNDLHRRAVAESGDYEDRLFKKITVMYRHFAEHNIRNKEDAEEVIQNALAVVARKYKSIEIRLSFAAWVHKILSNEIMKYYRRKAVRKESALEAGKSPEYVQRTNPDPDFKSTLLDCLKRLCRTNSRYARVLNLKYQGFSTDEICGKMEITPNNFHVILFRARSLLKQCLDKGDLGS